MLSMPGNDSGDRVHNFFPQDNLLRGNHQQQTLEGTWPVANSNFWVGGQIGLPNTSIKNDNIHHSGASRGQGSHTLYGQSGLNFTQTGSNFAQNIIQRQQLSSNGYMFGNHVNQTMQGEANILPADTIPDHQNLVSRGLSMYESHQGPGSHQHQTKPLVRSETSESPLTFNLFGNQQQMHFPQSSMPQSFHKQQSGFSDMQQLQQQFMLRKMQELQREQQLIQPDGLQQNAVNPVSSFSKQLTSSFPSAMVNGPLRADSQNSRCGTESGNTNWLQHASSVVQGHPNGYVTSANHGQAQSSIISRVQQGDQSVYGDTFSGSRGNLTQFTEISTEQPSMEQVAAFANNSPANQYQACIDQTSMQEEPMTSILGFPGEKPYYNPPGQYIQQVNPMKRNTSSQEIHREVVRFQEKTSSEDAAAQNEVSLDPTEARILYGSDDNIWAAFGKSLDDCEDAGGPHDQFPSGTWSALMQSAVAETSSDDVGRQEVLGSSSQREGSNISSPGVLRNAITDVRPTHGSVLHSGIPETNSGSYRGPGPPAHSELRGQYGKSTFYNPSDSSAHFIDGARHEPENSLLHSQAYGQKTGMNGEVGHGGFLFDFCTMPSSITELDHAKSFSGNTPAARSSFIVSNGVVTPNLSSTQSSDSSQAMLWRNINSLAYGSGSVDRPHHYIELENQRADSSLIIRGKANADSREMENCKQNDSSNNSYCSDLSHNNSSGGVKGNVMSDVSDSHSLPSGKKKYLNHNKTVKGNLAPHKFQYHSMKNVDEDTQHNHGVQNTSHSVMSQQSTDFESFKALNQVPKGPFDLEKVSSELPDTENCGSSASRLQQNHTSTSQIFGFQLGLPTHRTSLPSQSFISQFSLLKGNNSHKSQDSSDIEERGRSHLRNIVPPTSAKDVSVSLAMDSKAQQGTSFGVLPHMWTNIPGQPHSLNSHIRRTSSNVMQLHQPNVLESDSFPHKHAAQESIAGRISPSVSGSSSMNKGSPAQQDSTGTVNIAQRDELRRPEPASNTCLDGSPSNSPSMQRNIEAFGQNLMSNSSDQNYSLLHQMGIMKSAATDPYGRARKRMKRPESVGECQQLISTAKSIDNPVGHHASVSSEDSKILNLSQLPDNVGSKAYAQLGNVISQNVHASNQENSRFNHDGNNPPPAKVDHFSTSPQMTPSWLIQHGGLRNGHMLNVYDARRSTDSKRAGPLFSHGNTFSGVHNSNSNEPDIAADIGSREIGNIQQSAIPLSAAVEPQSLVLNVKRSKKREWATFQRTPWCKEVSLKTQNHHTISMAELHWAKATNRVMEKIEDEVKFSDGLPILRAKRRVILTTQLMQQLLSPPKSAILSSEAEQNFDDVAYSVCRLALGEACVLLNPNSDSDKSHSVVSLLSGNYTELEKGNERHLSKLGEGFIRRAQKLESDFLRLDNRASLVDVRSECQELEKFSVINRFAKFHGRGQAETRDASFSSNGAANALRPYLQRYVTALPVPRNLPDGVHCLSL